ncbi:hypothetical protein QLQ12_32330 [Actinoplanes sp. NEAU-A12]|uniref:Transposase IS4-like domain-containing protein n=1 Tax=Actinoplanes sandaracinus TaxID=3045177 RepID=A0ABT6WU79_9ACTN|nr:hypothetical protein [Actinoplanes sandaracinus]MDI6103306.1 hypothetical protein [Actinoplanes sandaracinus]
MQSADHSGARRSGHRCSQPLQLREPGAVRHVEQVLQQPGLITVYGFFARWVKAGVLDYLRDQLRRRIRVDAGRCPRPVAAIMDSQSVKAAETVSRDTRGFDGAKLINGRKRHLIVDSKGLLMT